MKKKSRASSVNRREQPGLRDLVKVIPLSGSLISFILVGACTPNQRIVNSAAETPVPVNSKPVVSTFESDLHSMRNADFKFILVFRRSDGVPLDADDRSFININTPDVNRRRLSDDGKAVIIGTNFPFQPGIIGALTGRFVMDDHSKPDSGPIEANSTAEPTLSPAATK